jgi:hypothetical protein
MKAIIHIGTQKTGTTTIQSFLNLNRSALSSQGIRFEPFMPRNIAQMELGLAAIVRAGDILDVKGKRYAIGVRGRESQAAFVDRLEARLRAGVADWPEHTFLASSEQIHAWCYNPARITALHAFLRGIFDDVRYVVYYRSQEDFMLSTYSENIRRGEMLTLDEHIDDMIGKMNFNRRVQMWSDAVGRENLTVRLFDPALMPNRDLLDDFCAQTGVNRAPLQTPPRKNESLSVEEIALYRDLNRRVPMMLRNGAANPLFFLLVRLMRRRLPQPGTRVRLSEAQRARIRARNAESNDLLRQRYFPELPTLFGPRQSPDSPPPAHTRRTNSA